MQNLTEAISLNDQHYKSNVYASIATRKLLITVSRNLFNVFVTTAHYSMNCNDQDVHQAFNTVNSQWRSQGGGAVAAVAPSQD